MRSRATELWARHVRADASISVTARMISGAVPEHDGCGFRTLRPMVGLSDSGVRRGVRDLDRAGYVRQHEGWFAPTIAGAPIPHSIGSDDRVFRAWRLLVSAELIPPLELAHPWQIGELAAEALERAGWDTHSVDGRRVYARREGRSAGLYAAAIEIAEQRLARAARTAAAVERATGRPLAAIAPDLARRVHRVRGELADLGLVIATADPIVDVGAALLARGWQLDRTGWFARMPAARAWASAAAAAQGVIENERLRPTSLLRIARAEIQA